MAANHLKNVFSHENICLAVELSKYFLHLTLFLRGLLRFLLFLQGVWHEGTNDVDAEEDEA